MDVSTTTVRKWLKAKIIKPHTNAIKPSLTEENILARIKFALQALEVSLSENVIKFKDMQNTVHIDEKWFNLTCDSERYYLTPEDEEPYRTTQSKRFILKVMFLCVVGRPLYDELTKECIFDGKIGMFPFTHIVPAERTSRNRIRGTLVTKSLTVTKDVTRAYLIDKVIPAIKQKWPSCLSKTIIIQQDNAKPHINDSDLLFRAAASSDGFDIHLQFQPPNSPDTNINDLGWFRALQSLQVETPSYNVDDLCRVVGESFLELEHTKLNKVFLTLQNCMIETLKVKGSNKYKVPHMGKDALIRAGMLPHVLQIDTNLVKESIELLVEKNASDGLEELIEGVAQLV